MNTWGKVKHSLLIMALFSFLCALNLHAATITYTYDVLNRLTQAQFTDGTQVKTIAYQYDAAGNMTSAGMTNAAATFSICGNVSLTGGDADVTDVVLTLSGAVSMKIHPEATGEYCFAGLAPGNYTVTPSLANYSFKPVSRVYTLLLANKVNQDFEGIYQATVADFTAAPTSGVAPLSVKFSDASTGTITTWSWKFGDGLTSTEQNPTHTYSNPGTYTVGLTVTGPAGTNTKTKEGYITVTSSSLLAEFTATPTSGIAPLSVKFTDASMGTITAWSWDFGDGQTSAVQHPSHTYGNPGTYTVRLTVTGPVGTKTKTRIGYITVRAVANAEFIGSPTSGTTPLSVSFSDASTGSVTAWSWKFGDGGTSTSRNPSHTYSNPGTYNVSLTVTGPGDMTNTLTKAGYITVRSLVEAEFTGSPTNGTSPLSVKFTDASTGSITTWSWSFGDGGTSTVRNPSHTYNNLGTYNVSLTVTGPGGTNTLTKAGYITVTPPPGSYYVAPPPLGNDGNDGTAAHPFATIQHALNIAQGTQARPATIRVAAGVYQENLILDASDAWKTLEGGWNNTFTKRWDSESRIDGGKQGPCFTIDNLGQGMKIDGFGIMNGYADGASYGTEGAGIVNHYSSPTVTNCWFVGNSGNKGGAMSNTYSSPTVTNCIFNGNTALQYGAGMYNENSSPRVIDCTFVHNAAVLAGGGMYTLDAAPLVRNCIFWNDSAPQGSGPELYNDGAGMPDIGYCLVQGGWSGGTAILNVDPRFVNPLGADGTPGTRDDNLHLMAASPCIDAGTNAVPGLPATDFDGYSRIRDGNNDGKAVMDMGAYEYVTPCDCDLNADGRCDTLDRQIFNQDWGRKDCNNPGVTCECDLNSDGRCDIRDWLIFNKNWGKTVCPKYRDMTR